MTAQLSRERLEKIASWREKFGADHNVMLPAEEAETMARMLLGGMGTAVAGFDAATAIRACMEEFPEHVHDIVEECAQIAENTISIRPAPPAPVAGVDDDVRNIIGLLETNEWAEHCTSTVLGSRLESEITRLVGEKRPATVAVPDVGEFRIFTQAGGVKVAVKDGKTKNHLFGMGWNACRAAMLKAGTVTGWIKCSERMPDKGYRDIWLYDGKGVHCGYVWDGHSFVDWSEEYSELKGVSHWIPMTLPAAPEQEV